jgi:hypothetical protein
VGSIPTGRTEKTLFGITHHLLIRQTPLVA